MTKIGISLEEQIAHRQELIDSYQSRIEDLNFAHEREVEFFMSKIVDNKHKIRKLREKLAMQQVMDAHAKKYYPHIKLSDQ